MNKSISNGIYMYSQNDDELSLGAFFQKFDGNKCKI